MPPVEEAASGDEEEYYQEIETETVARCDYSAEGNGMKTFVYANFFIGFLLPLSVCDGLGV